MDSDFLSKTEEQEWISRRVLEVGKYYSAHTALIEHGIEIPDEFTSTQILCPFHGDKNKPSARYYAASGNNKSHFYCFKCKDRLDGIGLHSRFNSKRYYESLSILEKRYGIKVPKKPTINQIPIFDKSSDYKSQAWGDVPRHIEILENKLLRNRSRATLQEYVKVMRLIDAIRWDYNQTGESSVDMILALDKAAKYIEGFTGNLEI